MFVVYRVEWAGERQREFFVCNSGRVNCIDFSDRRESSRLRPVCFVLFLSAFSSLSRAHAGPTRRRSQGRSACEHVRTMYTYHSRRTIAHHVKNKRGAFEAFVCYTGTSEVSFWVQRGFGAKKYNRSDRLANLGSSPVFPPGLLNNSETQRLTLAAGRPSTSRKKYPRCHSKHTDDDARCGYIHRCHVLAWYST